jgi:thiosulfate/3-mercaptopyruvate sulfurtransferase
MKKTEKMFRRLIMVFALLVFVATAAGVTSLDAQAAAKKPTKITLKATTKSIGINGKSTISVKSVTPAKASKKVTFKSSNKNVATVSSKGVVTGKKAGKATITATSKVNKKAKATIKITVKDEVAGDLVISASELKQKIKDGESLILVDARGIGNKKETVKNAITMDWKQISHSELTDGTKIGEAGYARSLSASQMSKALGKLGLGLKDQIILFSDGYASGGWGDDGRVAWQLRQCGYKNVKIVNGGLTAMKKAGIATQTGPSKPKKKTVKISKVDTTSHDITTEQLKMNYSEYKIVDVRSDAEYKGAALYGATTGGRLKGAIHISLAELFNKNGTLKNRSKLEKMFADAGLKKTDKIVVYCSGGIRSGYVQLILQELGYAKSYNYAESTYRWGNTASAGTADLWEQ